MRFSSPLLLALCLSAGSLVTLGVACGGSTSSSDGVGSDASVDRVPPPSEASTDGGLDAAEDASAGSLFAPDTSKIVVTSKGGHELPAPDGSACSMVDLTVTLGLPSRELSWNVCEASDAGPYTYRSGTKTLSESEFAPASNALHALRRATKTQCGADKPLAAIAFTTPRGVATYYDDFYFCNETDPKAYVTGLDEVLDALGSATK